jgi:translation initiation factor 2 subunit 2
MSECKEMISNGAFLFLKNMTDGEYDIDFLLNRAFESFSIDKGKIKLVMPIFEKKDRKSYIHNFQDVCKSINRPPDKIRTYLGKELNMDTSIKEDGSLKIDGMPKTVGVIEKFIKEYVINYIMCKSCKSCKTSVQKVDRIRFLVCDACKSKRAIDKS